MEKIERDELFPDFICTRSCQSNGATFSTPESCSYSLDGLLLYIKLYFLCARADLLPFGTLLQSSLTHSPPSTSYKFNIKQKHNEHTKKNYISFSMLKFSSLLSFSLTSAAQQHEQ
jgi:hypothetical protein